MQGRLGCPCRHRALNGPACCATEGSRARTAPQDGRAIATVSGPVGPRLSRTGVDDSWRRDPHRFCPPGGCPGRRRCVPRAHWRGRSFLPLDRLPRVSVPLAQVSLFPIPHAGGLVVRLRGWPARRVRRRRCARRGGGPRLPLGRPLAARPVDGLSPGVRARIAESGVFGSGKGSGPAPAVPARRHFGRGGSRARCGRARLPRYYQGEASLAHAGVRA